MIEFTVVIPTLNRPAMVREALGSVLRHAQSPACKLRVVVAEDGDATEPVGDVVAEFRSSPALVVHRTSHERRGTWGNVNAAIMEAEPKGWIHVVHDDDWVEYGFYDYVAQAIERHEAARGEAVAVAEEALARAEPLAGPERAEALMVAMKAANAVPEALGAVVTDTRWLLEDGRPATFHPHPIQEGPVDEAWWQWVLTQSRFNVNSVVFSRATWDHVGPFRGDLPHLGDWEWVCRNRERGVAWAKAPRTAAYVRLHPGMLTNTLHERGAVEPEILRVYGELRGRMPEYEHCFVAGMRLHGLGGVAMRGAPGLA